MRIATWNVNSVNARLETVLKWFEAAQPDVACLQEIKCVNEKFPASWEGDALFQPPTRGAFRVLKHLGLTDAFLEADGAPGAYTFWDYQAGAWQRNNGIRIDHALLSPQAADRLAGVEIHRDVRAREKPSDHVPVVVELTL